MTVNVTMNVTMNVTVNVTVNVAVNVAVFMTVTMTVTMITFPIVYDDDYHYFIYGGAPIVLNKSVNHKGDGGNKKLKGDMEIMKIMNI